MTADSKLFVALLAILQLAGATLYFTSRVRASCGINAAGTLLILLVVSTSWNQIRGAQVLFLAVEGLLLLTAIAGLTGRAASAGWWIVWTANLLMLAFSIYGAFFFHVF